MEEIEMTKRYNERYLKYQCSDPFMLPLPKFLSIVITAPISTLFKGQGRGTLTLSRNPDQVAVLHPRLLPAVLTAARRLHQCPSPVVAAARGSRPHDHMPPGEEA